MNIRTLEYDPVLLRFFDLKSSVLPKIVSSSEVYAPVARGALKGVPIGGLVGDQQGALVGNKCLKQGEAKCTYGTGAFLLFTTGAEPVESSNGLLTTVAYQPGKGAKPVYALEGSSESLYAFHLLSLMHATVSVAGSAIQWLRDSMGFISSAPEINELAESVDSTGGVYFVTAFSGLLAPYWDPGAAGLLIGLSSYTTRAHIARATLEASGFHTRAVVRAMQADSRTEMRELKVDGGMTNGNVAMQILADVGGFDVLRPEMRESTALGSALLAGAAVGFAGWDLSRPETLEEVNTAGARTFKPAVSAEVGNRRWKEWEKAVERSRGWAEGTDTDD
jgi:glycerol kinase